MSAMTRNLQLLWRSERVLVESRLKLTTRKLVLGVVAGIACLFAWGMLNIAGYFALEPLTGKAWSALIVGVADIVFAVLLIMIAQGLQPAPEEDMVREVRDMALAEIGTEVDDVQAKLLQLRDDVEGVRDSISHFVNRPLDALSPAMIGPALAILTNLVKAKKS